VEASGDLSLEITDINLVFVQQGLESYIDHADVVLPLEQWRDGAVKMQHPIDGNHCSVDGAKAVLEKWIREFMLKFLVVRLLYFDIYSISTLVCI
jgi:hypothetical protein